MAVADATAPRRPLARSDVLVQVGRWGSIASLVVLVIAFSVAKPTDFANWDNAKLILNQTAILAIVSFGLTAALVMGLFDLSIGGTVTLVGFLVPYWLAGQSSALLAPLLLAGLGIGAAIGIVNGSMVSYLGISAFIGTLAMGSILTGVVLGISHSNSVSEGIPGNFLGIAQSTPLGVPTPIFIMLGVGIVLWLFLERTEPGRHMYAIGGNAEAARLSGIRVKRYALLGLALSGVCAGLGGIINSSNLAIAQPQNVGDVYLLSAFAGSFIGASTLRPGQFHILGTFVGVLLLGVIDNGLDTLGVESYWHYIIKGLLLIFAIFASGVTRRGKGGINL
jgi:ribose transport system permease protein